MANFTPGPWQLLGDHIYAANRVLVAVTEGHEADIADCEACANGRLMAAAPDLLEACEALVEGLGLMDRRRLPFIEMPGGHGFLDDAVTRAQLALAKARGEVVNG